MSVLTLPVSNDSIYIITHTWVVSFAAYAKSRRICLLEFLKLFSSLKTMKNSNGQFRRLPAYASNDSTLKINYYLPDLVQSFQLFSVLFLFVCFCFSAEVFLQSFVARKWLVLPLLFGLYSNSFPTNKSLEGHARMTSVSCDGCELVKC